ncbi:hypothetical protein BK133_18185 [Paenibacillus sp. FSL H8-0548]|nr:hypothetical protein BK133_18185 [Paenibacillus sp. FSL H8-0548]
MKSSNPSNGSEGFTTLLVGATGLIGIALLEQLIRDPAVLKITVVSRRPIEAARLGSPSELTKLHLIVASLDELDQVLEHTNADVVFCTLGTTIKAAKTKEAFRKVDYEYPLTLARFAERTHASLFSVVTAMGASSSSRVFYSRVKGELQDALVKLSIPQIQIFQPSLLLGERALSRPGETFGAWMSKGLQFAMVGRMRKYRPIKGEDVARAMLHAASRAIKMKSADAASTTAGMHYYPSDKIAELVVNTTG